MLGELWEDLNALGPRLLVPLAMLVALFAATGAWTLAIVVVWSALAAYNRGRNLEEAYWRERVNRLEEKLDEHERRSTS